MGRPESIISQLSSVSQFNMSQTIVIIPLRNPDRCRRKIHFLCDVAEVDGALTVQHERGTVLIDGQTIILHVFSHEVQDKC